MSEDLFFIRDAVIRIEEDVKHIKNTVSGEGVHNIGLESRVKNLEERQSMVIGGFTGLATLGGILAWVHENVWPFHGAGH